MSTECESTQGKDLFVPCQFGESLLFPTATLAHSDWQMPLKRMWGAVLSSGNMFCSTNKEQEVSQKYLSYFVSLQNRSFDL